MHRKLILEINQTLLVSLLMLNSSYVYAVINPVDVDNLINKCSNKVNIKTIKAIIKTESNYNPFAIGIVDGSLKSQPTNFNEASKIIDQLERENKNYSIGLAQINIKNLKRYKISPYFALDPCINLSVSEKILVDCYTKAPSVDEQTKIHQTLSCYYSGNYNFGYYKDFKNQHSYIQKVINNSQNEDANVVIPEIKYTQIKEKELPEDKKSNNKFVGNVPSTFNREEKSCDELDIFCNNN